MWCLPAICRSYSERETMGVPRCISLPQGISYYLMWFYYIMIVSFNSTICISYAYHMDIWYGYHMDIWYASLINSLKKSTKFSILCVWLWFVHLGPWTVPVISPHLLPPLGATACHDCRVQGCPGPGGANGKITHGELRWGRSSKIPSGYVKITMERSTIFNGKIHDFYGHFQ
jgi:hypothetical protein